MGFDDSVAERRDWGFKTGRTVPLGKRRIPNFGPQLECLMMLAIPRIGKKAEADLRMDRETDVMGKQQLNQVRVGVVPL